MLHTADGSVLRKVAVIDDDPDARAGYIDPLRDLDLEPVDEPGPLLGLKDFVLSSLQKSDAAICDHRMTETKYATFDGASLVAEYYRNKFPALLCTHYQNIIDEIRPYRKYIPVLLSWDDIDPETIQRSFERVVAELRGNVPPSRRPWRTLVHVRDVDHERNFVHVFLPGWNPKTSLRLCIKDVPASVQPRLNEGAKLFAFVNIGAEKSEDLFFDHWEEP